MAATFFCLFNLAEIQERRKVDRMKLFFSPFFFQWLKPDAKFLTHRNSSALLDYLFSVGDGSSITSEQKNNVKIFYSISTTLNQYIQRTATEDPEKLSSISLKENVAMKVQSIDEEQ